MKHVDNAMYIVSPYDHPTDASLRQVVRRPADSDGIGQALQRTFARSSALPADIARLLGRIDR